MGRSMDAHVGKHFGFLITAMKSICQHYDPKSNNDVIEIIIFVVPKVSTNIILNVSQFHGTSFDGILQSSLDTIHTV